MTENQKSEIECTIGFWACMILSFVTDGWGTWLFLAGAGIHLVLPLFKK